MRLEKYSRSDLKRITREAYRELEKDKYENFVDLSRSHWDMNFNYDISWMPGESTDCSAKFIRKLDDRVDTIVAEKMGGKYPKNEVKFGGIVITLPRPIAEITEEDEQRFAFLPPEGKDEVMKNHKSITFFNHVYDFFCNRYGADNIIDMIVHRDEGINNNGERVGEDHATLYIVPECISRKNGKPTISAASMWDRKELLSMHRDLDQYMEQQYGIKHLIIRSEEERANDPKNLTLREYKLLMANAGNADVYADLTKGARRQANKIVSVAQKKADAIVAEAEKKAAEILAKAQAHNRELPQMPQQTQHGGYDRTYA